MSSQTLSDARPHSSGISRPPARVAVAILGAGPTGLEAALAASEMGLDFALFEAGSEIATNIASWGHVRLFSPWELDVSPRMRRALAAAGHSTPDGPGCPTGEELRRRVLKPLAELPVIAEHLYLSCRALAVGRSGQLKTSAIGSPRRAETPLRLLLERAGAEQVVYADAVLDCTGSLTRPLSLGDGGIPALGERAAAARIVRHLPDFDEDPERWDGRELLLVGSGHSAQTAAVALAALSERAAARGERPLHLHWAVRTPAAVRPAADDPLPGRRALETQAARLLEGRLPAVTPHLGVVVDAIVQRPDAPQRAPLEVNLKREGGGRESVRADTILSLVGSVGDQELYRELQVHECYATSGPMRLAAHLLGETSADCLAQPASGVEVLSNPEAGFFILGAKSYGRNSAFLMRTGWEQVEAVMATLAPGVRSARARTA